MLVYLGLGTNLGDLELNLNTAICILEERIGNVISQSGFYSSDPWGFDSSNSFLNAVVGVETTYDAFEILTIVKTIESEMGRVKLKDTCYEDRVIDIDLLFFGDRIIESDSLIVPHPLLSKRVFVLQPLVEIAPNFLHPSLNKTMSALLKELSVDTKKT